MVGDYQVNQLDDALKHLKKDKFVTNLINGVMLTMVLMVEGCMSFATLDFRLDRLLTVGYWMSISVKFVLLIFAKNFGMNFAEDSAHENNKLLHANMLEYERLNKLRNNNFPEWVALELNPFIKKKAYIGKINRRIYLLELFASNKSTLLYASKKDEDIEKKKANRYCRKRAILEELKSEAYIKANLEHIRVRYERVNASQFDLDIHCRIKEESFKTSSNMNRAKGGALVFGSFTMLVTSVMFALLWLDTSQFDAATLSETLINAAVTLFLNLIFVLTQIRRGMKDIVRLIDSEETLPYGIRAKILKMYLYGTNDANKVDVILDKISPKN